MKELSPHARIYLVLVIISGYLAMGELLHRGGPAPWTQLLVLAALAAAAAPLEVRLPKPASGPHAPLSLGLVFMFSALVLLPAWNAAVVSMVAVAVRLRFAGTGRPKLRDYLFALSWSNLALLLAYDVYAAARGGGWVGSAARLAAAAILYFLIASWSQAAALSLENGWPLVRTWTRQFLPGAPLYVAAAAGGALATLLFDPSYLHALILVFPVVCLSYYCYEFYFGRVRAERRRAADMADMYRRTVEALALAIEAKDRITGGHLRRVQRYAVEIGRRMGCGESEIKALEVGSLLHDIGKIAVPESLLFKPGRLTRQEFHQVAVHPQIGAEILAAVNFPFPVAELVHSHHERWDGSGYPRGLKGIEIPLIARILSVADSFDALISDRPYRPAFPVEKAIEVLRVGRGTVYDPAAVDVLLKVLPRVQAEMAEELTREALQPLLQSPRSIETSALPATSEEPRAAARQSSVSAEPGALRELLETIAPGLQVEEVARIVFSELSRVVVYDDAAVFLIEGRMLVCGAHTWPRPDDTAAPLAVPLREGPTGWVVAQASTLINGNALAEWGEFGRIAQSLQWRDALIIPLWSAGRVTGTLNLYSTVAPRFTEEDARLAELMAAGLGIALVKARAFQRFLGAATDPSGLPNTRGSLDWLRSATAEPDTVLTAVLIEPESLHRDAPLHESLQLRLREGDFLGRLGSRQYLAVIRGAPAGQLEPRVEELRRPGGVRLGSAGFPADAATAESLLCLAHQRLLADRVGQRRAVAVAVASR